MDKKKYIIIGIIALVVLSLGVTYAWYTWSTDETNETKIVTNLGAATVYYDAGSDIVGASLKPVATKEEGIVKNITVQSNKETTYKLSFNLYLDVISLDEGLKDASFKYELYKDETLVKEGNFTQSHLDSNLVTCSTNDTSHIVLINNETIATTQMKYTLYIWIDGTMSNPNTMQSKNFEFKLHADGQNAVLGETLSQKITNLYNDAEKTTVTNNSITYNYATSVSLMNDRLGDSNVGINDGNIRYYGANPNNYVDFGEVYTEEYSVLERCKADLKEQLVLEGLDCDNYEASGFSSADECNTQMNMFYEMNCGTEDIVHKVGDPKLYRIIGLFKNVEMADGTKQDLIKVVSNENIGYYSWDTSSSDVNSGWGVNEWSQSDLMKLLNPGYTNNTGLSSSGTSIVVNNSLYVTGGSGSCYAMASNTTIDCDFEHKAIGTDLQSKIASVVWNLGGHNTNAVYSNQIYGYERGENVVEVGTTCSGSTCNDTVTRTTEWTGKIALMYPSDYGYATDFTKCTGQLSSYNNTGCYDNDWLLHKTDKVQWLLTPRSSGAHGAWFVRFGGDVGYDAIVGSGGAVWPVFYLNSGLGIVSGNGSESTPYIVR